jgi:hypothetical protein
VAFNSSRNSLKKVAVASPPNNATGSKKMVQGCERKGHWQKKCKSSLAKEFAITLEAKNIEYLRRD